MTAWKFKSRLGWVNHVYGSMGCCLATWQGDVHRISHRPVSFETFSWNESLSKIQRVTEPDLKSDSEAD